MSSIKVDFRGRQKRVSAEDAKRQEATRRLILAKFARLPGVILCDEVGMGKTYVALGVIAEYLCRYPTSRILVLTPSADLAEKWTQDLGRFAAENVSAQIGRRMRLPRNRSWRLEDILGARDKSRLWILPISVFFHSRSRGERKEFREVAYQLLSRGAGCTPPERKVLWHRLGGRGRPPRRRKNVFWSGSLVPSMRNTVISLLKDHGHYPLSPERVPEASLKHLQDDLRWHLIRSRLRQFSLIVVDEAHQLKNPDTKRYRALEAVFRKAFRDMLFLTATPFQLGPEELEHIMALFALSSERSAASIKSECKRVTTCASDYQDAVRGFEAAWRHLPDAEKHKANRDGWKPEESASEEFAEAYRQMKSVHAQLQEVLSKWVVRNVQERPYRSPHDDPIALAGFARMPFAILQRLLHEYQRFQRTFSATQSVSLTSSWEAFQKSAVMRTRAKGGSSVGFYRRAMRVATTGVRQEHPKTARIMSIVREALTKQEKVLVFTSRIETVRALQRKFNAELEKIVYARLGTPRREVDERLKRLRKRMTAVRDLLWLVFRENYFNTELGRKIPVDAIYERVVRGMSRCSPKHRFGLVGTAKSPNWKCLSELCEWAVFSEPDAFRITDRNCGPVKTWRGFVPWFVNRPRLLRRALAKDEELAVVKRHGCSPRQLKEWLRRILTRKSIWDGYAPTLRKFQDVSAREELLEALARVLVVPEVLGDLLRTLPKLRRGQAENAIRRAFCAVSVRSRVDRFLKDMASLPSDEIRAFSNGLATESMVARASGEESHSDRLRHRYGFNTPFRPYVLVASDVMQEGLDLHKECSRIVHYDLTWNPARLEQRVGRLDRLGSRVEKLLEQNGNHKKAKLHIHRHWIPGTIDERMFRIVHERERWFKFILGHPPEWEGDDEDHPRTMPLPERFGKQFTIRLFPHRSTLPCLPVPTARNHPSSPAR